MGGIGFVITMALFIKCFAAHTPSSKPQEAPQLLQMVLLLPVELHLPILALHQVVPVMDTEKAAVTTTEEGVEEEEEELLMVVVDLQVNSTEVEETGEVGHRNRDPKDTAG